MAGENEETGMPEIGDENFSGPPNNTLRSKPSPEDEKKIEQSLEDMNPIDTAEKKLKEKTPEDTAKAYEEGLNKVGVTLLEARGIIENLVVHGYHEESTRIGPLTFTYRTRGHYDTLRTYREVETSGIAVPEALQEFVNRHNTAASLVSWGDKKFVHPEKEEEREDAFKERFDFLSTKIAGLVAVKMMQIVHDFDIKMTAVMADGAPEDF